jgi:hypothetical protein
MNTAEIETAITQELKTIGFKKKGTSWYLNSDESVCLFNLQKSNFGDQYYLNIGILIKQLSNESFPKENHCHIRGRLSQICSNTKQLEDDLNFEDKSISPEYKIAGIIKVIRECAILFFASSKTLLDLKKQLDAKRFDNLLINVKARKLLEETAALKA